MASFSSIGIASDSSVTATILPILAACLPTGCWPSSRTARMASGWARLTPAWLDFPDIRFPSAASDAARDGCIWGGPANAGVARLSEHPLPFRRFRRGPGTGGAFGPAYVFTAFEDSRGEIWAGTMGAINHLDLKTGRYTMQPIGENTEVGAITEDRSGQFWIGTIDGSLFRFNPATRHSVVYRHVAASSPGCGNNEVRALFVDHLGTLWAGARDSLCSFDPATNRFRAYKAGVEGVVEIDRKSVV